MEELKDMYKSIPKSLLRNKWSLCFIIPHNVYWELKSKLHNNRFMGIDVKTDFRVENDKMYLY